MKLPNKCPQYKIPLMNYIPLMHNQLIENMNLDCRWILVDNDYLRSIDLPDNIDPCNKVCMRDILGCYWCIVKWKMDKSNCNLFWDHLKEICIEPPQKLWGDKPFCKNEIFWSNTWIFWCPFSEIEFQWEWWRGSRREWFIILTFIRYFNNILIFLTFWLKIMLFE